VIEALGDAIAASLAELDGLSASALREKRREKYLDMGRVGLG
jgi:acetyl-CoA carboxylase alpha subunit